MHVLLQAWVWAELCFRLADATTDHSITRIGVSASLRTGAEPSPDVVTEPKLITGNALAVAMCVLSSCESFGRACPANVFKIRCEPLPMAKQSMRQQRVKQQAVKKKKKGKPKSLHLKIAIKARCSKSDVNPYKRPSKACANKEVKEQAVKKKKASQTPLHLKIQSKPDFGS